MANRSNSERLRGFFVRQTEGRMDICDSRVAFATENNHELGKILEIQPQVNYYNDLKCCRRKMDLMILGLGHFAHAFYKILVILEYLPVTFDFRRCLLITVKQNYLLCIPSNNKLMQRAAI